MVAMADLILDVIRNVSTYTKLHWRSQAQSLSITRAIRANTFPRSNTINALCRCSRVSDCGFHSDSEI